MLREQLIEARPKATLYADSIKELPTDIIGLQGKIASLALHPIKALGILKVDQAYLGGSGLQTVDRALQDRMAMIVRKEKGEAGGQQYDYIRFSQREEGKLALVTPRYDGNNILSYDAPDVDSLDIRADDLRPRSNGRVVLVKTTGSGDVNCGILENGVITDWLRQYLAKSGAKYNLNDIAVVIRPNGFQRPVEERLRGGNLSAQTLYSDGGQLLVASASTLKWMNDDLCKLYGDVFRGITMDAFRPNIVIDELPANAEDLISTLRVRLDAVNALIEFADPCVRCDVTRVDSTTGGKPDKEPLKWLSQNRPPKLGRENSTTFGINAVVAQNDIDRIIKVGSSFEVMGEKEAVEL